MRALTFAPGLNTELFQEPTRGPIQNPIERIRSEIKPSERLRNPQRDWQWLLNGSPFWGQFPCADVQKRQRRKAQCKGNGMKHGVGVDAETNQQWREHTREQWFAYP